MDLDQSLRVERRIDRQEQAARLGPGAVPTPDQALAWLRTEIANELAPVIQGRFEGRHATLLEDARIRAIEGEADWTLTPLAQAHLVCVESGLAEGDPEHDAVLGEILARTERDFLAPAVASPPPWD